MDYISDEDLIQELKRRFEDNAIALANLRVMTGKLESLNEKLRQSEALKSNFLSNIRNEINNPLTAITGSAQQLLSGKGSPADVRALALVIHNEAFDLDFQLQNIFAAAELEAGEIAISVARVDVAALIRNLIKAFVRKADEKRIALKFECVCSGGPEGALPFRTDPDKLQKIISNLLANAVEFNHEGKPVVIRAWKDGAQLRVSVADEGIGIPEADRHKIFDRFVQLDMGIRKRHRGQGLGLAITRAFLEILGGSISLTANEAGGSIFTISLAESGTESEGDAVSESGNELLFDTGTQF